MDDWAKVCGVRRELVSRFLPAVDSHHAAKPPVRWSAPVVQAMHAWLQRTVLSGNLKEEDPSRWLSLLQKMKRLETSLAAMAALPQRRKPVSQVR
jgi:hypothetical protein